MIKLQELLNDFKPSLERITSFSGEPKEVYDPINYILDLGGKRIRPALVLASYRLYNDTYSDEVFKLAEAVEMFHNFTLLHDDIMDNATMRRGKETAHIKWNEPTAILSGDLLQIKVYEKLGQIGNVQVTDLFTKMAIELCEGQMNDMLFETRSDVSNDQYLGMIRQKTAVLLAFAMQGGALLGGANLEQSGKLYDLGIQLGMTFQLMDDYLDTFGSSAKVGKRIGGDILERKKTYLWNAMWSTLRSSQKEEVDSWYNMSEEETIEKVRALMIEVGADQITLQLAQKYTQDCQLQLEELAVEGDRSYLAEIVELLVSRES